MSPRREFTLAVVGCAAGAGLALWAVSRTWVITHTVRAAPQPPLVTPQSGGALTPLLPALALVALACAGGLLATRSVARVIVAGVMALAGLGLGIEAVRTAADTAQVRVGWSVLTVVGAVLVVAAAGLTLRRGRSWPALGARYDRPGEPRDGSAVGMWDAIDRGIDPTTPTRAPTTEEDP